MSENTAEKAPETGQKKGSDALWENVDTLLRSAFGRRCDDKCNFACGDDIHAIKEAVEQYATARVWEAAQ